MQRKTRLITTAALLSAALLTGGLLATQHYNTQQNNTPTPTTPSDTLPLVVSSSGTDCLNDTVEQNGGWIHIVADGEQSDLTYNMTIAHGQNESIDTQKSLKLTKVRDGVYALRITTQQQPSDARQSKTLTHSGCKTGTEITGAGELPNSWETLRVTVNGTPIRTVHNEGTMPQLRRLPNPINTTQTA
ncbi:hypothetical protein [Halomicrococcus sp. SG-WS-1]|uniref:hypothetical protein n=1 Tax=Halomicrococcus sp. SG-WS-1 TaxID=3439057 RepID=UPI003F79FAC2